MLWLLFSCMLGYQKEDELTTISIEQTYSTHHYNIDKPLKSSLKIVSLDENNKEVGHGSGNYFKIGGNHFIISASHLVKDDDILWAHDHDNYIMLLLIHNDVDNDIAILVPYRKLENITPINYSLNNKKNILGSSVVYAGFPADINQSVFSGMVSKVSSKGFSMQGFALPGSSGSVVFDNSGKVMGVVSAVKVGYNGLSPFPEMYPTLVYVSRLNQYSRKRMKEMMAKWKSSQSEL